MATFPSDSVRTKNWGNEILTDSDLETQLDLIHNYIQAALNSTTGHAHTGSSNQGPKLSPANLLIASQATGDILYASSATAWSRLAKGTSYQVLQMNSGATLPEWGTTGTAANQLVRLDSNAKIPAVDGSQLTGIIGKVQSGTVTAETSFTISSLVVATKYKLIMNLYQNTLTGAHALTFNGDNGANYRWGWLTASYAGQNSIILDVVSSPDSSPILMDMIFSTIPGDNKKVHLFCNTANYYNGLQSAFIISGYYAGASDITSLTMTASAGTMTGTWELYKLS